MYLSRHQRAPIVQQDVGRQGPTRSDDVPSKRLGFDQSARVSEYTANGIIGYNATDHCVRIDDITFHLRTSTATISLTGSDMILFLKGATEGGPELKSVTCTSVTWWLVGRTWSPGSSTTSSSTCGGHGPALQFPRGHSPQGVTDGLRREKGNQQRMHEAEATF